MENAKRNKIYGGIISSLIYFVINLYAHFQFVPLQIFFMDDIALFLQFRNENLFSYLLNGHDLKFRPVSDLFLYLGYIILKGNTEQAWIFILMVGTVSSIFVYAFIYHFAVGKKMLCAVLGVILFSNTRFAYYSVGQYFGIMESIGTVCSLCVLACGIEYIKSDEDIEYNILKKMNIAIILAVFSHERYLTLYVFGILCIFIKYGLSKRAWKSYTLIIINVIVMMLFRIVYLGDQAMQGTGGSNVLVTLDYLQILKFLWWGILLILGWNAGEGYLNGIEMKFVSNFYNSIPFICLIATIYILIAALIRNKQEYKQIIKTILAYCVFILFTLISGCITIRLELRWIYVPYMGYVCLVIYLLSLLLSKTTDIKKKIAPLAKIVIGVTILSLVIITEYYYRTNWVHNYIGRDYTKYNNIYNVTIKKYGANNLAGKSIVFIENKENGTTVLAEDIMKRIFDYYCGENVVNLFYSDSINELPGGLDSENTIYIYGEQIYEDIWEKSFYDVSYLINEYVIIQNF